MRWGNIYIASLGSDVPEPAPALAVVEAGLLDPERFKTLGYTSICADDSVAPPDRAVAAARVALRRGGVTGRDLGLLLHCSLWFQGLDIWPAASYVAARVGARGVPGFDVQQRCNVGLSAIEMAAALLAHGPAARPTALITTADRFALPAINRWNSHDYNIYGDGATALVLSAEGGFARVLSTATVADNTLEEQARGDEEFTAESQAALTPIDLIARSSAHAARTDSTQTSIAVGRVMMSARYTALKDARIPLERISRVVTPATGGLNGGRHWLHDLLGVTADVTTWDFGRTTGHVGAGDWALGLEHLIRARALAPGDHVLLFGGGAGFTCTAAVVEILDLPEWE